MARIRTIKPEFWTDEAITECSLSARLLFIGMWNFADDAGNLDRSAKQLKIRIFPTDKLDCEPLIQELIAHGLLIEYSVSDKKYLHIPGFAEHQVINRPSKPTCPDYQDSLRTHATLTEPSVNGHGMLHEDSGLLGKGSIGKGGGHTKRRSVKTPIPEDLTLTPELTAYVRQTLPDANAEALFEKFTDQAKAADWRYLDWTRAFQTYCRNAAKDSGHFAAGQYPKLHGSSEVIWR